MNGPDDTVKSSIPHSMGLSETPWTDGEFIAGQEPPTIDPAAAFASLGFITAALKRRAWVWCAIAMIGLLIGCGLYIKFPPAYQATTSVLLTNNPDLDPTQIQTNATLAQSTAVAGRVVNQLGLRQTVSSFIASYTVTPAGEQVLVITVGAPSSTDAVRRASALATDFLQFRAQMLESQQQLEVTALAQQVNQAQQQLNSVDNQISQLSTQPASSAQLAELSSLRAQRTYASNRLTAAQATASSILATTQSNTAAMVKGSVILDAAAPMPRKFRQSGAFYFVIALILGLAVGMGIVVIRALVSDRLRTRDDVADAIGAPVRLSIGPIDGNSWLPGVGRRATRRTLDMRRIVAYLGGAVRERSQGPGDLAVVAVDNYKLAARIIVSLALSSASKGKQVIVADLSSRIFVARLLGVKNSGVRTVNVNNVDLIVAVPDDNDVVPIGPLPSSTSQAELGEVSTPLAAAYASADLLLTFATLDPATGGDHLATWATQAVVMVTAGRSSSTKIRAVGEMIRLAGTRLVSVVLIGADKSDESLGVTHTLDQSSPIMPAQGS